MDLSHKYRKSSGMLLEWISSVALRSTAERHHREECLLLIGHAPSDQLGRWNKSRYQTHGDRKSVV